MTSAEALEKAITTHLGWKGRLRIAISSGKFDVATDTVKADNQCEFGKWLYGSDLSSAEKQSENYRIVKQLHAQFHQEAAKVVELATSGQKEAAEKAMGIGESYGKASHALTEAISKWRESVQ